MTEPRVDDPACGNPFDRDPVKGDPVKGDPVQGDPVADDSNRRDDAYGDALRFLYDRINYERMVSGTGRYPFRLQRIKTLLGRLGLQRYLYDRTRQPEIPLIHIAGTKGKGSTASMVAAGLTAAGLKTGLYTSPHLHHLEERFRVNGLPCSPQEMISLVQRIQPVVAELSSESAGSPSFFELTTAMGLLHFESSGCDAIVLEVGLGGRLDSTNVCSPSVTTITSIGLDHEHVLGNTVEKIAAEKAGIIKAGVPLVSGVTDAAASEVISQIASERGAPLFRLGYEFEVESRPHDDWGSHVTYRSNTAPLQASQSLDLRIEGTHQARNAALAIASIDLVRSQGVSVPPIDVAQGLNHLQCEARIERFALPDDTVAIVDAAHNHDSIEALCDCLGQRCGDRRIVVVFGTSHDKSAGPMLASLAKVTDRVVLTQFQGNPRYQPTDALLPLVPESLRKNLDVIQDPIEACKVGLQRVTPGGVLVVCGSFFLAAETRTWLAKLARTASR